MDTAKVEKKIRVLIQLVQDQVYSLGYFLVEFEFVTSMELLGDDGVGYELAKKLDSNGGWRAWLGDSHYMQMAPYLNSFSAWKNFMSNAEEEGNKSNAHIHLQLRVRALLFDKATANLYLRSSSSASLASLHPSYLQLHADDIYYSLEEDVDDWHQLEAKGTSTTKAIQMKSIEGTSSARSRFIANEVESASSRSKNGDILDTWYSQWREKHLKDRMHRFSWRLSQRELPFGDRETYKRTPEGMSAYLMFLDKYRKKRRVTKQERELHSANSSRENMAGVQAECKVETGSLDEEICFFPETMFPFNCVPDNSVAGQDKEDENPSVEIPGIFENLPFETTRSPLLIERFGMGSEYLSLSSRKVDNTGKGRAAGKRKRLSEGEATYRAHQTVVRIVEAAGFEGLREGSMDVLSQLLSCHICKLGRTLRLLADSFRNHYTQFELLRMFLHTIGYSNLVELMAYIKTEKRPSPQQTQQQLGRITQTQRPMIVPPVQQLQRQLSQQNMTLTTQSQWEKLRRKQALMPRSIGRKLEKDRTIGDVNLETSNDSAADCKVAAPLVSQHHAQWQHQQQQQSVQMPHHSQSLSQFKQHPPLQLTQIQQPNLFSRDIVQMRTQPVKVEGFQELMGGDVNVKETEDEIGRTLMSPRKL